MEKGADASVLSTNPKYDGAPSLLNAAIRGKCFEKKTGDRLKFLVSNGASIDLADGSPESLPLANALHCRHATPETAEKSLSCAEADKGRGNCKWYRYIGGCLPN